MDSIKFILRRGSGVPTLEQLKNFEMGWSVTNKKLYINDNGNIVLAGGGGLLIGLNGAASIDEGDVKFFAPKSITGQENKLVKMKSTFTVGQDPFEYVGIENTPIKDSMNIATSGALWTVSNSKVDKVNGSRLMTDAEGTKLAGIAAGSQVNVIEKITVNGSEIALTGKTAALTDVEKSTNKVSVFSNPTDTQYPTAKLVSDQLALRLNKLVINNSYTTEYDNRGNEAGIYHRSTNNPSVDLLFKDGRVFLPKYTGGNTPTIGDGTELLNRSEIGAMIDGHASRLITHFTTSTENGDVFSSFPTAQSLFDGPWYYQKNAVIHTALNEGDYAYVKDDEFYNDIQTMYVYDGDEWVFSIEFAEDPLVPDDVTLEVYDSHRIRIKNLGVGTAKIADNAITTPKIGNAQVTIHKLISNVGTGDNRLVIYGADNSPRIITLNDGVNTSKFYAPTEKGSGNQYLKPGANGVPVWDAMPIIPTIKLNGVITTTPDFYAPTAVGSAGMILQSNGSGIPSWTDTLDGGTW